MGFDILFWCLNCDYCEVWSGAGNTYCLIGQWQDRATSNGALTLYGGYGWDGRDINLGAYIVISTIIFRT